MTGWIKPCGDAACIEYRVVGEIVWVRNSRTGSMAMFSREEWDAFVAGLRAELAAENARLRIRAAANERTVERTVEHIRTTMAERVAIVDADYEALKAELVELRDELARALRVVRAAVLLDDGFKARKPGGGSEGLLAVEHEVAMWRAAQPDQCICNPTHRENDPICRWQPR